MQLIAAAAAVSVMVTIMLVFLLVYWTSTGGENQRVRQRLGNVVNRSGPTPTLISSALRQTNMSGVPILGSFLSGRTWADKVARSLELADLRFRVGEYLAIRLVLALVAFAGVIAFVGRDSMSMLMGVGAALVGYHLPRFYVKRRAQKRLAKFNNQLVEALSLVANSLRSGFGLLQSMDLAAEQLEHPLATEFRRTITDVNVGASFEEALTAFNERISSKDLDIVITAILIQRTVGGNLAEVLDTVAHTMRERARIAGEIRTLTAQQRMSGFIVGGLPVVIIGILTLIGTLLGQSYVDTLFTTNAGRVALLAAGVLEGIGILLIKRILKIEV